MELQFRSNTCRCVMPAVREVRSTEVTQEVRLTDGMPDIGRVLASWGQIVLRSKEWQQDQVTVSGGIMVWILYAPEDGTQPRCMDTWIPFQLKWDLEGAWREGGIRVSPLLRFVDSRSVSARKLMVRAGVAALAEALSPMETEVFEPADLPEDIQTLRNTYPIRLPKEAGERTFLLDEDLIMPAGAAPVERILCQTVTPQIHEKRVAGDKVILRGTGNLHVIYRCSEGKIHTADFDIPISQYAQLDETYGTDGQADVMMGVTSLELDRNEESQLRVKCGLVAQYLISDRYLAELTEDAYSPRRQVALNATQLQLPAMLEQRVEVIPFQQQLPGITGEVADVCFWPDFPRQTRTADKVMLDLPGQFQLLYYGEDGSLQGTTSHWEGSAQIAADTDSRMDVLPQPQGKVQAVPGASEMNLTGQYPMQLNTTANQGLSMVTGLQIGELQEADPSRPSLILCRPDGESLWNIAKRCGSTVEEIQRANRMEGQRSENRILLIPVD